MKFQLSATMILAATLCACASAPTGPYWEDKAWMQRVTEAAVMADENYLKIRHEFLGPYYSMGVDVNYVGGKVASVELARSGGDVALDEYFLKELEHADFPVATGPSAQTPHHILLDYEPSIPSRYAFGTFMLNAIDEQTRPGLRQRWPADSGYVLVEFHYQDGAISDASILYNDAGTAIGQDALASLLRVKAPDAIPTIAGKNLDLEIGYCFLKAGCNDVEMRAFAAVKKAHYEHEHP